MMKARAVHGAYIMPSGKRYLEKESYSGCHDREKRADVQPYGSFLLLIIMLIDRFIGIYINQ